MVWKRRRRHDGIHDLDTRAHDWRDLKSESVERWSKIPSMVSCGILGMVTTLFFESIQGVAWDESKMGVVSCLALVLSKDGAP